MSLQLAAQHMASKGRGPDTTLVHMAPQEVAGLQALAKAHGGSLTINPDTGLPEAGFLSSILPMVAGAFLGPAGLGLTAMQAGLAAGALGTVATGSLKKGLMAGLGAYGGAGLAGSIMGAGTGAAQQAAMAGVEPLAGGYVGGLEGVGVGSSQGVNAMDALSDAATQGMGSAGMQPLAGVPGKFVTGALPSAPASSMVAPTNVVQSITNQVPTATAMPELTYQGRLNEAAARVTPGTDLYKAAGTSVFDTAKAGLGEVMKRPGDFLTKENLQYGLMGLAPAIADYMTPEQRAAEEKAKLKPFMYAYDPGRVTDVQQKYTGAQTGERTHFNPIYTRTAAGGGLMDLGPVEAMSERNQAETLMANGGMRYAEGGETKAVKAVEEDPYYTMSGQSGDAFKYLMGQMPTTPRAAAPAAATAPAVVQSTVQPTAAPESSSPFFNLFGGLGQTATQGSAGGEWVDDTSGNIRPYTFDPATGTFTAAAPKKVFRPYTSAPTSAAAAALTSADLANRENFGGLGMAQGGITGSGNLNLNIPLDLGGGQGGYGGTSGAGYSSAGAAAPTGFNGQNNSAGGFGPGVSLNDIDPKGIMSDTFKGSGAFGAPFGEAMSTLLGLLGGSASGGTSNNLNGTGASGQSAQSALGGPQNAHALQYNKPMAGRNSFGGYGMAQGGIASLAQGGPSHLGDYSDGGRLLRGPGDGVSDDIPATIGEKRPARLADGEFVVPARIVSELGNGSTEAGARKLYAMMDRVQKARKKSIGKNQVAVNSRAEKLLPA